MTDADRLVMRQCVTFLRRRAASIRAAARNQAPDSTGIGMHAAIAAGALDDAAESLTLQSLSDLRVAPGVRVRSSAESEAVSP